MTKTLEQTWGLTCKEAALKKQAGYQDQFDIPPDWEDERGRTVYEFQGNTLNVRGHDGHLVELQGREAVRFLGLVEKIVWAHRQAWLQGKRIPEEVVAQKIYALIPKFV